MLLYGILLVCGKNMADEKYIHGKHDDAHHEGKASEIRRLMESDDVLTTMWPEVFEAASSGTLKQTPPPTGLETE